MDWHSMNLGKGSRALHQLRDLQNQMIRALRQMAASPAGTSPDFAMFSRIEDGNTVVYFTPGAADFAQSMGAAPCPKPPTAGIAMLLGEDDAWDHFPDR